MKQYARVAVNFDKTNKQQDFRCIAKDLNGNTVIGWVAIEQPWYTGKAKWTYRMYTNVYGDGGFCGGSVDLGMNYTAVDPSTIKPYTQIAEIENDLEQGYEVLLYNNNDNFDDSDDDLIAVISSKEDIPYYLWDTQRE